MTQKKPGEQTEALALMQPATEELRAYDFDAFALAITELEDRGKALGKRADKLPVKATAKSAERSQEIVREARLAKRDIPDTWNVLRKIQGLVKLMVGRRQVAERSFDAAIETAQEHHFLYVDAENKRVAAEQERKRLEAEAAAAKKRARELADIEAKAVAADEASPNLSEREERFVEFALAGAEPVDAARAAGYSSPEKRGPKLAKSEKIKAAIEAQEAATEARRRADAVREAPLEVEADGKMPEKLKEGTRRGSAEILDHEALRAAVIGGTHGIPVDVLIVDAVRLNQYARELGKLINRWPGCRLKIKRTLV